MKSIFTKITSTFIALLVLFSTFSFTVESHYCGEFLIDVSITGNTEVCSSDIAADASIVLKDCCSDEVHQIVGQDELQQNTVTKFDFQNKQFLTAFCVSYADLFTEITSENSFYKDFSPPDIPLDYQVSYQTFLI